FRSADKMPWGPAGAPAPLTPAGLELFQLSNLTQRSSAYRYCLLEKANAMPSITHQATQLYYWCLLYLSGDQLADLRELEAQGVVRSDKDYKKLLNDCIWLVTAGARSASSYRRRAW
ncbi:MAG: hypothetical protein ACKPKO_14235, partial [Candidatus Fonsibacter sp.]